MVKFTKENLDWDIILKNISEKQLAVFTDEEIEHHEYGSRDFNKELTEELDYWVRILFNNLVIDHKLINLISMSLANKHKNNWQRIKKHLIHSYQEKLVEYNEYLEQTYSAKDYLEVKDQVDINKIINEVMLAKENNKSDLLAEALAKKINNYSENDLVNIIILSKIDNLNCC